MNIEKLVHGTPEHTQKIRELNDQFRKTRMGGRTIITAGICAEGAAVVSAILKAVAAFDAFSPDNDPWDEHDCAGLTVLGIDVLWKIDYYDLQFEYHSHDAADPDVTMRVLTVMRVDEY